MTRGQRGAADTASLADAPWWDVFQDLALQALVDDAIRGSHDLRAAAARVEQAHEQIAVARADVFPQVGYQAEAVRQRTFLPGPGNVTFNSFLATFNLAWEVDVWGRIRRATEAARAEYLAAEAARRGVLLTLVSDVAQAYFELLELDRELEITQGMTITFQDTLDLFRRRYAGGIGTLLEVSRAQAAVTQTRAGIPELERQIVAKENQLSTLLGRPPGDVARRAPLEEEPSPPPEAPVGLPSQLLERRPDVLEAEQALVAANAEVGVAVGNFFPRVGLTTFYGGQSSELENIVKSAGNVWAIGGSLAGPLFQGGRLLANYRASSAAWAEAVERYQQTTLQAFAEVSNALVTQEKLKGVQADRDETVQALRTSVDLSLQRYNDGIANYFEVLEAEQQLFPAELDLARTHRDRMVAVVTLYRVLGGGWRLDVPEWGHAPQASSAREVRRTSEE